MCVKCTQFLVIPSRPACSLKMRSLNEFISKWIFFCPILQLFVFIPIPSTHKSSTILTASSWTNDLSRCSSEITAVMHFPIITSTRSHQSLLALRHHHLQHLNSRGSCPQSMESLTSQLTYGFKGCRTKPDVKLSALQTTVRGPNEVRCCFFVQFRELHIDLTTPAPLEAPPKCCNQGRSFGCSQA